MSAQTPAGRHAMRAFWWRQFLGRRSRFTARFVGRGPAKSSSALCVAFGLFLVGIGVVLLIDPEAGERHFGFGDTGILAATGIRQAYLRSLVLVPWWAGQWRALGIMLLTLVAVPIADFLITLAAGGAGLATASEHLLGLAVLALGVYVLRAEQRHAVEDPVRGEEREQQ